MWVLSMLCFVAISSASTLMNATFLLLATGVARSQLFLMPSIREDRVLARSDVEGRTVDHLIGVPRVAVEHHDERIGLAAS